MPRRKSSSLPSDPAVTALLQTLHPHAAGIDVGATELGGCVPPTAVPAPAAPSVPGGWPPSVRCCGAFTADLHAMAAWLRQCQVTTGARESTGVYWLPLDDLLERVGFQELLVDPRQRQRAPHRPKTDVHDCQWSQRLHSLGLLTAAFRPEEPSRVWRVRRRRDNEATCDARQRLHGVT